MEKELLTLTPKRFLCPICGEWHEWKHPHHLGYYNPNSPAAFTDSSVYPSECASVEYTIFVNGEYLHYTTGKMCGHASLNLDGKIPIESIIEYADQPIVTFDVPFTAKKAVGRNEPDCSICSFRSKCNLIKLSEKGDSIYMKIPLGFEFEQSEYMRFAKVGKIARKERELQERENALKVKEQSLQERESALRTRKLEQQRQAEQSVQQEIKEDTTMANNIFNMNMEFGPSKDENIASTLMGVAVKNGDSWRIYDKNKKEITDVGDMQLGNLPIFIIPTTKLSEGDLIKDNGEYYFVTKLATSKTLTQTLSARTGEMKSVVPIKNILGLSCYSKVIALSDSLGIGDDDFNIEELAIMSSLCGQNGENNAQMNQMFLPLMLMREKDDGDDDMKKKKNKKMMMMIAMTSMMSSTVEPSEDAKQSSTLNQFLPLLLLKEKDGDDDDDMMNMILMSYMMGGNMANSNNPLMGYLLLDAFMGKKDDKDSKASDDAAK